MLLPPPSESSSLLSPIEPETRHQTTFADTPGSSFFEDIIDSPLSLQRNSSQQQKQPRRPFYHRFTSRFSAYDDGGDPEVSTGNFHPNLEIPTWPKLLPFLLNIAFYLGIFLLVSFVYLVGYHQASSGGAILPFSHSFTPKDLSSGISSFDKTHRRSPNIDTATRLFTTFPEPEASSQNEVITRLPSSTDLSTRYSFIVIGGGRSGLTLGVQVAEGLYDGKVLILEAGTSSPSLLSKMPPSWDSSTSYLSSDPAITFSDVPLLQNNLLLDSRNRHPIANALAPKGLGGGGESLVWAEGVEGDFNQQRGWNVGGWEWDVMKSAYAKVGKKVGACSVADSDPSVPEFMESCRSKYDGDGGRKCGRYEFMIDSKTGLAGGVVSSMLVPALASSTGGLRIITGASVTRVLFTANLEAHGVEFIDLEGKRNVVYLNLGAGEGEGLGGNDWTKRVMGGVPLCAVVLSAGSLMSPQVLENSGVGRDGAVVDMKGVGENLSDQSMVPVIFKVKDGARGGQGQSGLDIGSAIRQYIANAAKKGRLPGILGSPSFSAGVMLRSPYELSGDADVEVTFHSRGVTDAHIIGLFNFTSVDISGGDMVLFTVKLLRQEARFRVVADHHGSEKNDKSRLLYPSIDFNGGLAHNDEAILAWAIGEVRDIASEMICVGEEIVPSAMEGGKLRDWVKASFVSTSNWSGSLQMGYVPKSKSKTQNSKAVNNAIDQGIVVNQDLQVLGIANLMVVDSSVFPRSLSGGVGATKVAVGGRGADIILGG